MSCISRLYRADTVGRCAIGRGAIGRGAIGRGAVGRGAVGRGAVGRGVVALGLLALPACVPSEEDWAPSAEAIALASGLASASKGEGSTPGAPHSASLLRDTDGRVRTGIDPASRALAGPKTLSFTFAEGSQGFVHDFAGFAPSQFALLRPSGGLAADPFAADESLSTSYQLTADTAQARRPLVVLLQRPVGPSEGLRPSSQYVLDFYVTLTSSAPLDCSPSDAAAPVAVLKAGALSEPPNRTLEPVTGTYEFAFDSGKFAQGGVAMSTGFDAVRPCEELSEQGRNEVYRISHRYPVTTNSEGYLWLLVSAELGSTAEATELLFSQIDVALRPTRSADPRSASGS